MTTDHNENLHTPAPRLSRREALIRVTLGAGALTAAGTLGAVPGALAAATERPTAAPSLNVGAKDFTEDQLIGHMYTLLLQQAGFSVTEHFNLPTSIAHSSLVRGDIDLYPEYTGTGLVVILKSTAPNNDAAFYKAVAAGYQQRFHITWLKPSPMNDTQGLATTQAVSKKFGFTTISGMVKQAPQLRAIMNSEFLNRPDGLPGLKRVYGNFTFKSQVIVAGAGSLRYAALTAGRGDVVVAFTTDGPIVGDHLVLLVDDKHYAPPDQVAPVVRDSVLQKYPQISSALNKLAPTLTTTAITNLNYQVDGLHKDLATVAKTFLQQHGLLKR
ncbi:MAG: opuCC [Chloroflexi bacterium]|nr:opuCC [Chloroflexota bacterium]